MKLPIALLMAAFLPLSAAQFSPTVTTSELKAVIERAEKIADDLDDDFEDALDKTLLDGTDEEERLGDQAEALEDTLDKIRSRFDDRGKEAEVRDLVGRALSIAQDINRVMLQHQLKYEVEEDWRQLRADLNVMARYFGLGLLADK